MKVLECAMTNLGNSSGSAIARLDQKVHQAIERLAIETPAGLKHTIGKKIYVGRKRYRDLDGRVFGIREATDGRTAG